jgi:hypothetical protein
MSRKDEVEDDPEVLWSLSVLFVEGAKKQIGRNAGVSGFNRVDGFGAK